MTCVGGVLVRNGHVLLGLRSAVRAHYPNVWDVFGGHACPGECPEETLVRELQEEIGVTPTNMSLLDVAQYSGPVESYEYCIYMIKEWEGTPENRQPEEHTEICWVTLEQLGTLRFAHPAYLHLFRRAIALACGQQHTT